MGLGRSSKSKAPTAQCPVQAEASGNPFLCVLAGVSDAEKCDIGPMDEPTEPGILESSGSTGDVAVM